MDFIICWDLYCRFNQILSFYHFQMCSLIFNIFNNVLKMIFLFGTSCLLILHICIINFKIFIKLGILYILVFF